MATRIIEFSGSDRIDRMPVLPYALTAQTPLTATGTSQASAPFNESSTLICVQSDETIHVARGANPTATVSNYKIRAGSEQFFSVKPGERLAIITGS